MMALLIYKLGAFMREERAYRADQRRIARLVSISHHPAGRGRA